MMSDRGPVADQRIAEYLALKPAAYSDVVRLEVRQTREESGHTTYLDVELLPVDAKQAQRLRLSFEGVLNLRLTPPERMVLQFSLLEIWPIGERQWEGVGYSVRETEHNVISFLCRDFRARLVE